MLKILLTTLFVLSLLAGSGAATVYAAQGSLPDQALYPVKTWSEDARLALTTAPASKLELTLAYTDRRLAEIAALQAQAAPSYQNVALRLQTQLDAALQIAANLPDSDMPLALAQIRQRAEIQVRTMTQLMDGANAADPTLARLQARLQEQIRLAAQGEADPQIFRQQFHFNQPTAIPPTNNAGQGNDMPGGPGPNQTPVPSGTSTGPGGPGPNQTSAPSGTSTGPGGPGPNQTPAPLGSGTPNGAGPGSCTPTNTGGGQGHPTATPQPGGGSGVTGQPTQAPNPGGGGNGGRP